MKAIHLTAYGNPAQNLQMVEVPRPNSRLLAWLAGNAGGRFRNRAGSVG